MSTTGKHRGISADFRLDDSAGSLIDISNQCNNVDLTNAVESFDVTAFQDTGKAYLVGFSDGKFSVSGFANGTIIAHLMGLVATAGSGTTRSFQWGPEGTTSGNPKFTGECFVTSFKTDSKVNAPNTFQLDLQVTGAITATTY